MLELIILWFVAEMVVVFFTWKRITKGVSPFAGDRLYLAPAVISAGISGLTGLAQLGIGIAQKAAAKRLARSNVRPVLKDNQYIDDAYKLTESMAGQGLSQDSLNVATTQQDRSLASSINAVLKSGGSANNVADLYDGSQQTLRQLTFANEEAKVRSVSNFLKANTDKANEERDQFFVNEQAPFKDRAALSAAESAQGMDNIFKGVNTIGGGAMNAFGMPKLDDTTKTTPTPATVTAPRDVSASVPNSAPVQMPLRYGVTAATPLGNEYGVTQSRLGLLPGLARQWNPFTKTWQ